MPTERLDRYLSERRSSTPCIVIDLDIVRARYSALKQVLPAADTYCAVTATRSLQPRRSDTEDGKSDGEGTLAGGRGNDEVAPGAVARKLIQADPGCLLC